MHELLAGIAAIGEEQFVIVDAAEMAAAFLGKQRLLEADAVALREDMELADRRGLVAGVAKGLCQRRQMRGIGRAGWNSRSPWPRGLVPVIIERRAGMQIGHSA